MPPRKGKFNKRSRKAERDATPEPEVRDDDIFEANDSDPDEDKHAGQRYDRVDNYEYELPSDFEDEEIDEDEAFNEEDERLYGHLFASKGGDSGGDESESEEEGSGEFGLLDSDEDDGSQDDDEAADRALNPDDYTDEEDEKSSDEDEEGSSSSESEEDEGDQGEERAEQQQPERPQRKRRRDFVVTEAYPESEFNLPQAGGEGELTLTDLIAGLEESRGKLGSSRKELERLQKKAAPVAAPLPGPIKQRQERKAGYDESKKEVAKWMPIVKANREAPTLRFTADTNAVQKTVSTAALASKHVPETAMEAEVARLLEAAGAHTAQAVAESEEALALKELTVEEAQERRNRLAKMRALLFYHEVKAKRLKKIKSKDYRRRLKKVEKRKALGELDGEDGDIDDEMLRREREDAEYERAKERLTLKHKNTSRFIRRALKRGGTQLDEGTREAVEEQLRLGREIRERVNTMRARGDSDDSDAGGSTSASDDDSDDSEAEMAAKMTNKTMPSSKARKAALDILQGRSEAEDQATGLFSLPFMRRALEKKKLEAEAEANAVLGIDDGNITGGGASGRMSFGAGSSDAAALAAKIQRMEEAAMRDEDVGSDEDEDAEAKAERLQELLSGGAGGRRQKSAAATSIDDDDAAGNNNNNNSSKSITSAKKAAQKLTSNGTLSVDVGSDVLQGVARQKRLVSQQAHLFTNTGGATNGSVSTTTKTATAFIPTKQFQGAKPGYVFSKGPKGVGYYADPNAGTTTIAGKNPSQAAAGKNNNNKRKPIDGRRPAADKNDGADEQFLLQRQDTNNTPTNVNEPLSQAELVRRAFAGDDVAAEFAADKATEVEAELPQDEIDTVLPGWGTWSNQKREPQWMVDAKKKAQQKKEAAAANRKDAKLQYVIISEKYDKKASKYRTPSVPYPYDSKETYERAMRQPLGKDYNTDAAFRNLTRPAVIKDAGVIIQPIKFSAAVAEHDAKAPKNSRKASIITVAGGMPKRQKTTTAGGSGRKK